MCAAMNNCGVNGICHDNGQCVCNRGFSGADCGQRTQILTSFYNKIFNINGTQHIIFEYREGIYSGERWEMTISSTNAFDLYLNPLSGIYEGSVEPSEFDYISAVKQQTYLKVSSDQYPSLNKFASKIRVAGINHYDNQYMMSQVKVQFVVYSTQGLPRATVEEVFEEVPILNKP